MVAVVSPQRHAAIRRPDIPNRASAERSFEGVIGVHDNFQSIQEHNRSTVECHDIYGTAAQMAEQTKLRAVIIVVSETASNDPSTDKCIPALQDVFATDGGDKFDASETAIVPDDVLQIQHAITQRTDGSDFVNLIVLSGGTGFTQKDVTPEVRLGSNLILDHLSLESFLDLIMQLSCVHGADYD